MHDLPDIELRPFADSDSVDELTILINKAYQPLAERRFRYMGSYQDAKKTAERIGQGECWVAVAGGIIIGTIRYRPSSPSANEWYNQPGVASLGQFAVASDYQKLGVGGKLLDIAEGLAKRDGAFEIALDTADGAIDLIEYYSKRGYRLVGFQQWEDTNYRSVIMSKSIRPA